MNDKPAPPGTTEADSPPQTREEQRSRADLAWSESMALEHKRRSLFSEMTAVTVRQIDWRSRWHIMTAQRLKIEGLKTQMSQMQKGYRRKIAKLEKRIAELEAAHG